MAATQSTWALGWGDAVWGRRVAQPALHAWTTPGEPTHWQALTPPRHEGAPKALACPGLLVRHRPQQPEQLGLRCVEGRPVSAKTTALLAWCSTRLAAQGIRAVLLLWDHASWHSSHEVRTWLRQHHHQVKQTGQGVRILACRLPSQSPWLHPITPKWVHGKRAIVAPDRLLSAQEMVDRVYAYYGRTEEKHWAISAKAA